MAVSLKGRYTRSLLALLLAYLVVIVSASVVYQLRASHYADGHSSFEKELHEIQAIVLAGLAVLPAMLFVIDRLCRRMLRPLHDIRITAERIVAGRLLERIRTDHPGDDLGRLAATLNQAFDRYQDSLDRLHRFASDASHQLRSPLTSIRTTGEVCLQRTRTPDEYQETIGSMLEDADRLRGIVEKLLVLARLGAETVRAGFTTIDLAALCRTALDRHAASFEVAGLSARLEAPPAAPVRGDAALLEQVFDNLFDNAVRHTWRGCDVRVAIASGPAADWIVTVSDTGPGISAELAPQLFERFSRGANADLSGHGLGLAIVADTVKLHGGTIALDNGPGATFRIVLPAA